MIKERVRAIINTVPFSLSELLESWLLRYVVNRLNLVPTRNSVAYVSPRENLYGRKINVDKELNHGLVITYKYIPTPWITQTNPDHR